MSSLYYRYDKEKDEWNIVPASDKLPTDIKLCPRLIETLNYVKKDLHKDRDVAIIIFGDVGSGKSTLGRICCRYVSDEKFSPRNNMVRDVNDIAPIMKKIKKYQGLVFDEASGIFGSADTNTKKTKYAQLVLDVCRQKNLFLVIIAPQFHRLTAPVALDRTQFALRTYFNKKTKQRGEFCFYGTKSKAILYDYAKKNHGNIKIPRLKKRYGEFGDDVMFRDDYVKLKDETLNLVLDSFDKPKEKQLTPIQIAEQTKRKIVFDNPDKKSVDLASMLGVSQGTINRWRREIKREIKQKKLEEVYLNSDE